jgi:hypothetical protein
MVFTQVPGNRFDTRCEEEIMQINNLYLNSLILGKAGEAAGAEEVERRRKQRATVEVSRHTPSADLIRWLALVQQQPEIRLEVLDRVAQRLAAGLYLTHNSARQTAEAMLVSPE